MTTDAPNTTSDPASQHPASSIESPPQPASFCVRIDAASGLIPGSELYGRHQFIDRTAQGQAKRLRAKGIYPFRNKFTPAETCQQARGNYVEGREVAVAGRITAHRDMGKSMFIDVRDQSGRIQGYAQKNVLGDEQFQIFTPSRPRRFRGRKGTLFTTKTGEISIKLASFTILAKALRPPPGKWHGLEDTETRYRQRYLDLIANPDVKDVMLKRSADHPRDPRIFPRPWLCGGGDAHDAGHSRRRGRAAVQDHHNALGCEFYLRIALELYHKRLLVGGMDKLFEIGQELPQRRPFPQA